MDSRVDMFGLTGCLSLSAASQIDRIIDILLVAGIALGVLEFFGDRFQFNRCSADIPISVRQDFDSNTWKLRLTFREDFER